MQSYRKTASFQCCLLRQAGWSPGCKLLRTGRSSGVGSCPTLVFSHRVRNNLTKFSFHLIPYLFFGFLSHVASTRYQETSHANLSRSAWSQPSEDVDFWEVLQRGESDKDNPSYHCCEVTWTLGHQVTNLLGKKKVYVYYMNKLSQLRVYLDRSQVSLWFLI